MIILFWIIVAALVIFGMYKLSVSEVGTRTCEKVCDVKKPATPAQGLTVEKGIEIQVRKIPAKKTVASKPVKKVVKKTTKK